MDIMDIDEKLHYLWLDMEAAQYDAEQYRISGCPGLQAEAEARYGELYDEYRSLSSSRRG